MSILPEAMEESLSLTNIGDTTFEMSVTSCEYVNGMWVCQTSTTAKQDETSKSIEKTDETSKSTEKPDETPRSTLEPEETPKSTEEPDETPRSTLEPEETPKSTEEPDETPSSTEKPDENPKVEKDERSAKPTEKLSLDESKFLSEFFLPIADALTDEEVEAWVVPSQYDPSQSGAFVEVEIPINVEGRFMVFDEKYPKVQRKGYDKQVLEEEEYEYDNNENPNLGYYGYENYEQILPFYPRLVKKWRRVPCSQMYKNSNPLLLFINDDEEPFVEDGMCGIVASALIIMFVFLFCCMIQKLKKKNYRNQFSREKRERLLVPTEAGKNGSYVPPTVKLSVKKSAEKSADEPHIIFI